MPKYRQTYTLFKRGKYYYYRTYTPAGIRTTAKTTGCTTLSAARLYCDKLYQEGRLCASSGTRFASYAKDFFTEDSVYASDNHLSKKTIKNYSSILDSTFIPLIGQMRLEDITYTYIKGLRQKLSDTGVSVGTLNAKMGVLRIILTSAYMDGIIFRNPFDNIKNLTDNTSGRDAFTLEEVKFIFDNSPQDIKAYVILLSATGMRLSEACGVLQNDICKEGNTHYIHLTKQIAKNEYAELKTKNARDIPISDKLLEYIGTTPLQIHILQNKITPIIRNIDGWKERKLCLHSFRHFFISSAKSYGINHLKVETIAGHSLKGIQKIYTQFHILDLVDIIEWQNWLLEKLVQSDF